MFYAMFNILFKVFSAHYVCPFEKNICSWNRVSTFVLKLFSNNLATEESRVCRAIDI